LKNYTLHEKQQEGLLESQKMMKQLLRHEWYQNTTKWWSKGNEMKPGSGLVSEQ
jgi:hypothetical protein